MSTKARTSSWAIIVLGANNRTIDLGVRGFIPDAQVPSIHTYASSDAPTNNDTAINKFKTGCGDASVYPTPTGTPSLTKDNSIFRVSSEYYQGHLKGEDEDCQGKNANKPACVQCGSAHPQSATCGGHYHDYSRPRLTTWGTNTNTGPGRNTIVLSAATTGVRSGGIVRAVLHTNASTQAAREVDHIGYVDPNVPCNRERIAQWYRVEANRSASRPILGWYPVRTPTGDIRHNGCT